MATSSIFLAFTQFLLPANEVCEGYAFTGVCLSTGGLCPKGSLSGGVSVWGVSVQGGHCLGGLCVEGGLCLGFSVLAFSVWGVSVTENPPPYTVTSRWYASSWNAFLYEKSFAKNIC